MKVSRIILLLLTPFVLEVLSACCTCEVDETYEFRYSDLSISNVDNEGRKPLVTSEKQISKTAYGLNLTFTTLKTASLWMPHFFAQAKAARCSCPPPYESDQKVKSFKIITVNDFDANHQAGADVTEYFRLFMHNSYVPVNNLSKDTESIYYYFDEKRNISINMFLMISPLKVEQQFTVEMEFSDGKLFRRTTPMINLI